MARDIDADDSGSEEIPVEMPGRSFGARTTGATGSSVMAELERVTRDGAERERRNEPRAPTALARRRSKDETGSTGDVAPGDASDPIDVVEAFVERRATDADSLLERRVIAGSVRTDTCRVDSTTLVAGPMGRLDAMVERVTADGDDGAATVMASAVEAANAAAPETDRLWLRSETEPTSVPSSADRAAMRRRNDSAAAGPGPVTAPIAVDPFGARRGRVLVVGDEALLADAVVVERRRRAAPVAADDV